MMGRLIDVLGWFTLLSIAGFSVAVAVAAVVGRYVRRVEAGDPEPDKEFLSPAAVDVLVDEIERFLTRNS